MYQHSAALLSCEGVFYRPSSFYTIINSRCTDACDITPVSYTMFFPVKLYDTICSSVSCLLRACSPSTVTFRIRPIIIRESIKRMFFGRSFSHIIQKIKESLPPFFADSYSSTSIFFIAKAIRIITPSSHPIPYSVSRASSLTRGVSVLCVMGKVFCKTAAGFRQAIPQIFTKNYFLVSTFASTKPTRLKGLTFCFRYNRKSTKRMSCKVDELSGVCHV